MTIAVEGDTLSAARHAQGILARARTPRVWEGAAAVLAAMKDLDRALAGGGDAAPAADRVVRAVRVRHGHDLAAFVAGTGEAG